MQCLVLGRFPNLSEQCIMTIVLVYDQIAPEAVEWDDRNWLSEELTKVDRIR